MARPSRNVDRLILESGRILYPEYGGALLPIRKIVETAGVNLGMFHYHFKNKENFLRCLHEEWVTHFFHELEAPASLDDSPRIQLRSFLLHLAQRVRDNSPWLSRLWADVAQGEPMATELLKTHGSRHLTVLGTLLQASIRRGEIHNKGMKPLGQAGYLLGAVVAPMLIAPKAISMGMIDDQVARAAQAQILSDGAILQRIDLSLASLSR